MRVHQPGSHLMQQRGAQVDDWSWARTARRIGVLVLAGEAATAARTTLAVVALLAATATALAPPYLAKIAIDDGIRQNDLDAPRLGRRRVPRRRAS